MAQIEKLQKEINKIDEDRMRKQNEAEAKQRA